MQKQMEVAQKGLALRLGIRMVQDWIFFHNMSPAKSGHLVDFSSPVLSLAKLCQSLQYFMFSSTVAFWGLLVQNESPVWGGHSSPWALTCQSQSLFQRAKVKCCKLWHSPAEGQSQSLPGCRLACLSHTSLMAFFFSQWSRTPCDVYHWLPRHQC